MITFRQLNMIWRWLVSFSLINSAAGVDQTPYLGEETSSLFVFQSKAANNQETETYSDFV